MRIESRTLLLFVTCALLPVVAFALLGFAVVNAQLRHLAQEQLDATAKNYGLLIYDRLQQVDQHLTVLAQSYLQGKLPAATIESLANDRARIRAVTVTFVDVDQQAPAIARDLRVMNDKGHGDVVIEVSAHDEHAAIRLAAQIEPQYLWNIDALPDLDATLCVMAGDTAVLSCTTNGTTSADAISTETASAGSQMSSSWKLFLNATYAAPDWTVRIKLPESTALSALRLFRWILPVTAVLAVAIALLAGSIFIRRSHAPLRALTDAARRIGRRRFSKPIRVDSDDEYGRLARSFNRMAGSLRDQFDLLAVLARVDRAILSRAGTQPAVDYLLHRLPRLLRCPVAGILLLQDNADFELKVLVAQQGHIQQSTLLSGQLDLAQLQSPGPHHRTIADADTAALLERFGHAGTEQLVLEPIVVKHHVRGYVIVGEQDIQPRSAMSKLRDIAHRLAVAIGNDDRERALWQQAHLDSLTRLPNRLLLRERLASAVGHDHDDRERGAVIFMDLDRFKSVNDSLGHTLGDSLLQQVAARLTTHVPAAATLSRFGGDEFVIVFPGATRAEAGDLTQRLLDSLREPLHLQDTRYVTQASAGIALFPDDGSDVDTLLKNADIALYRAKSGGRGRLCFFDDTMSRDATDRLLLEDRLREAILERRICAWYQPKMGSTGEVVGVEALARWQVDERSSISPAVFIPLAEETGLVVPLGELMLREVCRHLRNWRDRGVPVGHVAINISMMQMRDPQFPDFVLQCLADEGLSGDCLEIELTESLFAEDSAAIARQLTRLVDTGVRVAIDDFGTGFSSMSRLRQFPIHSLKIDRAFVADCARSHESRMLLKALIDVGHALNLQVVAEGVEEPAQLSALHELRCDVVQGYLFSPALPPHALEQFLASNDVRPALRQVG